VYADCLPIPGAECRQCGALYENGRTDCEYCSTTLIPVEDMAEIAVAQALTSGALIEQLRGDAARRLSMAGGLGAFLRY
jgi:hypothetical protein